MNCTKYSSLIEELVEGELETAAADAVNAHILACRACEMEFEKLINEKEMFSHFLFEVEPPIDLPAKFNARLAAENQLVVPRRSFSDLLSNLFSSFSFVPVLGAAVILLAITIGFFLLRFTAHQPNEETLSQNQTSQEAAFEKPKSETADAMPTQASAPSGKKRTNVSNYKLVKRPEATQAVPIKIVNKAVRSTGNKSTKIDSPPFTSEELAQIKDIQAFEAETSKQIEKIELLLRAFRNARYADESEEYDLSFEKQQANKLLAKNIELRRKADAYGTFQTSELLNKVEPYLLEISNLDPNPSEEEVLGIKQRVKNQNIIISLQGF